MRRRHLRCWLVGLAGGLLLGLVCLDSLAVPGSDPGSPVVSAAEGSIRVMSFNVRYGTADDGENSWDLRRDLVTSAIADVSPDILCTQEVLAFQAHYLREALPGHGFVGVGRDDGNLEGEMCAIFFARARFDKLAEGHFWLSETPKVVASKSWDAALTRMVSWVALRVRPLPRQSRGGPSYPERLATTTGQDPPAEQAGQPGRSDSGLSDTLYVFNTHFDHQGTQARLKSALLLKSQVKLISAGKSAIIAGDFNAPANARNEGPYRVLVGSHDQPSAGSDKCGAGGHSGSGSGPTAGFRSATNERSPLVFVDTYRSCHPEPTANEGTFNDFTGHRDGPRIDWILVTPGCEVIRAGIYYSHSGGRYPSDHFPVYGEIELKKRSGLEQK